MFSDAPHLLGLVALTSLLGLVGTARGAQYGVRERGSTSPGIEPIPLRFDHSRSVPTVNLQKPATPPPTIDLTSNRGATSLGRGSGYGGAWWEYPYGEEPADPFLATLYQHLELGTHMSRFSLDNGQYNLDGTGFIGNVRQLDEVQTSSPFKLFVTYWFIPYVGVDFSLDKIEAEAVNENNGLSDGTVEMSGPILSLVGRYPNATRFTPYAGIGYSLWSADFNNATWWHLGYPDPETWEADGKPTSREGGRKRTITVSEDNGYSLTLGLVCHITQNWSADVFYRKSEVSSDVNYKRIDNGVVREDVDGKFPLDHTTYGLGVRYSF